MKIVLVARDEPLAEAWQRYCGELDFVQVHHGSVFEVSCDAVMSPANSSGFMDGGIDMSYSQHFGWQVQTRLQDLIRNHHHGELLVGTAEIVETDHPEVPYLISAPTMRVPMILRDTVNPYLAARATLILITHGEFRSGSMEGENVSTVVDTLAIPGLGTGVGQVDPDTCARQVRAAIDNVVLGKTDFPETWSDAQQRHQLLYRDWVADLQFED